MSIEFVEPETPGAAPADPDPATTATRPARSGRLLAAATLVAAVLAGVGVQLSLYVVDRTAFVVDFDATTTQDARIPYDAFGHPATVDLVTGPANGALADSGFGSTLSISLPDGISYGPWWIGLAVALLLVAVWGFVRPRSPRPAAAVVAALGGLLLGGVGAAWLAIRTVSRNSVPQIRFAAHPALGLWLLVAAGALAVLAGLLAALRPPLARLLPQRRA